MKVLVVFAVCLAAVYAGITDEQKAKLKEHRALCVIESGVDDAVIEKIKAGEQVTPDEKVKCFSACMLKKIGIMKADGTLDEEVARAKIPKDLPKEKVDLVINKCKAEVVKDNSCETGGKVLACLLETKAVTLLY